MARLFNGSTEFLRIASALGLVEPFTVALFCKPTNLTTTGTLFCLCNNGSSDAHYVIFRGATSDFFSAASNDQGVSSGEAQAPGAGDANWSSIVGQWAASNSRRGYRNGAAGTSETTNVTPTGLDEINIGRYSAASGSYAAATLQAIAAWSIADLTAGEVAAMNVGFPPRRVRPQSLVFYVPLVREVIDMRGAAAFATATGAVAEHHRAYGF